MKLIITTLLAILCFTYQPYQVHAQTVICSKKSNGVLTLRSRKCRTGETRLSRLSQLRGKTGTTGASGTNGSNGLNGTNGVNGTNGADGALRVWGDGSAGDATLSGTYTYLNPQYANVTIQNIIIESGQTIRATGTCTITGTVNVQGASGGGFVQAFGNGSTSLSPVIRQASQNLSYSPATAGEFGPSTNALTGGVGGGQLTSSESMTLTKIISPMLVGGAGAAGYSTVGGAAGGTIALYCKQGIIIAGSGAILALGSGSTSPGGGGGAGGLIILASTTSVTNNGVLNVSGGNGGDSSASIGAGGGGGGGVIRLLAPSTNSGTTFLAGGSAGSNATSVTSNPRIAGSGGGGLGGAGGNGGNVAANNTPSAASSGTAGYLSATQADPTSLIL